MLVSLILFIVLMGTTLGGRLNLTWPEKFIHDTVTFFQQIFYRPATYVSHVITDVSELKNTYEENKRLKKIYAQYIRDKAFYSGIKAENDRLYAKLAFTARQKQRNLPYQYRIAQVTSINVTDPYNQTLNINLGKKSGIQKNMPVISEKGIVGIVSRVFEFSSTVQLLSSMDEKNLNFPPIAATVLNKENKSFGIIESYDQSNHTLLMTRIHDDDELKTGDIIVSSGLGGSFPRGLVIGKVVSRQVGASGLSHTAIIEPATTYRDWQELFIVIPSDWNVVGGDVRQ